MNDQQLRSSSHPPRSTDIVPTQVDIEPWRHPEWQRLWLAIESQPWNSLAIIPAGEGGPKDFTLNIAVALSRTGMVHLGSPIQLADATGLALHELTPFFNDVRRCTRNGDRLLIALPAATQSAITASIAQSVDAALLCVLLDRMSLSQAKKTVKAIGQARFLGSVIIHPSQLGEPKKT